MIFNLTDEQLKKIEYLVKCNHLYNFYNLENYDIKILEKISKEKKITYNDARSLYSVAFENLMNNGIEILEQAAFYDKNPFEKEATKSYYKCKELMRNSKIYFLDENQNATYEEKKQTIEKNMFKKMFEIIEVIKTHNEIFNYYELRKVGLEAVTEIEKQNLPLESTKSKINNYLANPTKDISVLVDAIAEYNMFIQDYWVKSMTPINQYKEGEKFKFLVHNITKGFPEELEFSNQYISTSLITDEINGLYLSGHYIYGEDLNRCGFILVPKNIISAQDKDTYTRNKATNDRALFLDNKAPYILSPETIEERCLNEANQLDEESISEQVNVYSEIVLKGFYPSGIFCITNGEKTLNDNYNMALKYSKKYELPLIDINQRIYRKIKGFAPLSEDEMLKLTHKVLKKITNVNFSLDIIPRKAYLKIGNLFNYMQDNNQFDENLFIKESEKIIRGEISKESYIDASDVIKWLNMLRKKEIMEEVKTDEFYECLMAYLNLYSDDKYIAELVRKIFIKLQYDINPDEIISMLDELKNSTRGYEEIKKRTK